MIRIGISACLLGEKVRYDGGHKHDRYLTDTLGRYFEFVPVCPEAGCGLTTPREAMRLVGDPGTPRLVTIRTGIDHTERMQAYCLKKTEALAEERLSGFIFKARSPSCGVFDTQLHMDSTNAATCEGMFAKAVITAFPELAVEDEETIKDQVTLERFLERVKRVG
jgi:uncharacterized protein YbbK (DUF523 family)